MHIIGVSEDEWGRAEADTSMDEPANFFERRHAAWRAMNENGQFQYCHHNHFHIYPGVYHGFISLAQDAEASKRAFGEFSNAIEQHFREKVQMHTLDVVPA